jgi:predicted PurR-regulated permease PerM
MRRGCVRRSSEPALSTGDNVLFLERVLAVAGLALLAWLLYLIVEPFLAPLAWAVFIGFLFQPAQARLARWLRGRESISAFLLTTLVLLLFIGPLTALAVAFARQAAALAGMLQEWMGRQEGKTFADFASLPIVGPALAWLDQYAHVSAAEVQAWLIEGGHRLLERLASLGGTAFLGAVGTVLSFTAMLFLLFFFIRDGRAMAAGAISLVPLPPARRDALTERLALVTRAVMRGTILTAIVQGLLLGIGFALVGLPAPVVFGVIGAILSVVPFGGTALVWVPAVAVLAFQGRYGAAVALAVVGAIVSSVDNFLKPLLISGRATVPTLAIFIGVIGGLAAFGMIGLFLGPVVIALVLALVQFAQEQ